MAHPGTLLGNQRGGFIFAHPFPPLGTVLMGTQFPLALSPESVLVTGVSVPRQLDQKGSGFVWSEIQRAEARGKKVLVNGQLLLKVHSPLLASKVVQLLRSLTQASQPEREKLIRQASRDAFDGPRIEQAWHDLKSQTSGLRLATNALFIYLFVLSPVLIWRVGFERCWLPLLAGLLGLTCTIAIRFHRAHKTLFPAAEDERFTHFLIFLLSPATAIRALDVLSRSLLESYHPVAIAKVFCPAVRFEALARTYLRELRYQSLSDGPRQDVTIEDAERYWQAVSQRTLEDFLKRSGLDPEALLKPPAPTDETCLSYCPRCLAQFTTREGVCADCGGVPLARLKSNV